MKNNEKLTNTQNAPELPCWAILPHDIASVDERYSGDISVVDALTGEVITNKAVIIYADSRRGFYITKEQSDKGINYSLIKNPNLIIKKDHQNKS